MDDQMIMYLRTHNGHDDVFDIVPMVPGTSISLFSCGHFCYHAKGMMCCACLSKQAHRVTLCELHKGNE